MDPRPLRAPLLTLEDEAGEVRDRALGPGDGAHVAPGRRHRFEAVERVELVEVSTPELDDVVRLADDFGREGSRTLTPTPGLPDGRLGTLRGRLRRRLDAIRPRM